LISAGLLSKAAMMEIKEFTSQQSVGVWYELGEVLRQGGALPQATEAYQRDLAANPYAPETHNMLGAALGQQGKSVEAAEHLRTAIRLSPEYTGAMLNLGIAYATQGNLTGAAQTWNRLLEIEPKNEDAARYLLQIQAKPKK
jgi:tetratricopeptide (TPR) repeat protein